jgi:hypothetical protein
VHRSCRMSSVSYSLTVRPAYRSCGELEPHAPLRDTMAGDEGGNCSDAVARIARLIEPPRADTGTGCSSARRPPNACGQQWSSGAGGLATGRRRRDRRNTPISKAVPVRDPRAEAARDEPVLRVAGSRRARGSVRAALRAVVLVGGSSGNNWRSVQGADAGALLRQPRGEALKVGK